MPSSGQDSETEEGRYPWVVLGIVMLGTMMATLDSSIVNVSLPAIMADFGASVDDIEWVITGYMLSFATLMPLTGWFRSVIGHKQLYLWALTIFTLGSLLCGLAWNLPTLIAARVLQALGGGAIAPTAMAMVSEVFHPRERGKAIGYWGVGVIMGPAFGPTLGGFLTKTFGWRSIFTVNLPIGVIGFLIAARFLRHDKPERGKAPAFDLWGFTFLSVFLVCFLLGLSNGEKDGWSSPFILWCFALAVVGFVGFLLVEFQIPYAIMDLSLFEHPVFTASMIVNVIRSVALFGGVFLLPLFLQTVMGRDEIQTGLIMLPGSLAIAVLMPISGRLGDRTGPFLPTLLGLIAIGWSLYMYRDLDINTSTWGVIQPTLVRGLGLGLLMAPSMAAALNAVPRERTGMASSMLNIIQQVGGSLGIAALGTVLSHRIHFHLAALGSSMHPGSPVFQGAFQAVRVRALQTGYPHMAASLVARMKVAGAVAQAGQVRAFDDAFIVAAAIVALGVAAAFLLPMHPVIHSQAGPETAMME